LRLGVTVVLQQSLFPSPYNPQTRTFTYDTLDRLASAVAVNGTNGTYALQNYAYNTSTGNLSIRAGVKTTYGDTNTDGFRQI